MKPTYFNIKEFDNVQKGNLLVNVGFSEIDENQTEVAIEVSFAIPKRDLSYEELRALCLKKAKDVLAKASS